MGVTSACTRLLVQVLQPRPELEASPGRILDVPDTDTVRAWLAQGWVRLVGEQDPLPG